MSKPKQLRFFWVNPWSLFTRHSKHKRDDADEEGNEPEIEALNDIHDAEQDGGICDDGKGDTRISVVETVKDSFLLKKHANFIEKKIPRTYNIVVSIIIPLFLLIAVAFACGYGLAKLEAPDEKATNDMIFADWFDKNKLLENLVPSVVNKYDECFRNFVNSTGDILVDYDVVVQYMHNCTIAERNRQTEISKNISDENLFALQTEVMSYHWITCTNESFDTTRSWEQSIFVTDNWRESYDEEYKRQKEEMGLSDEGAHMNALENASGSDECIVNTAGGAIFWFTIMTTIGYGNTAPITPGGRLLVYFMGFVSILAFTAVMGHAGYILLVIVDDFFYRKNLKKLTEGFLAVLFWLCMLILWILVLAGISVLYTRDRYGDGHDNDLAENFWWAFISVTTVGFGDVYIPHDVFRAGDMFYVPLILLLGFVMLANFLYKLSDFILGIYRKNFASHANDEGLGSILYQNRKNASTDEEVEVGNSNDGKVTFPISLDNNNNSVEDNNHIKGDERDDNDVQPGIEMVAPVQAQDVSYENENIGNL